MQKVMIESCCVNTTYAYNSSAEKQPEARTMFSDYSWCCAAHCHHSYFLHTVLDRYWLIARMVKIKVRKKSVLLVLLLFVFAYVCSHIEDKIGNLLPRKKLPLKDSKGYVNCAAVDNYCYRSEFNLDILGEVVSKSVVLCSSGESLAYSTLSNIFLEKLVFLRISQQTHPWFLRIVIS